MIDHDRLFKELISTFFWEFIELFFPEVSAYLEREPITFLPQEIFTDVTSGDRREVDLVAKCQFRGKELCFLIHVENQSQSQTDFSERMFFYFARLYEKHRLPVYPVVIFSFDYPLEEQPNFHRVEFPDKVVLDFNHAVIQLNRLNWRDFLQQPNPVAAALMSKMRIARKDRIRVKLECLRLLATLRLDPARMQLISGFVDTYLRLNAEEERQFQAEIVRIEPVEREEVMEIVTSWMEQGIEQGIERGKQELVLRLLTRRFGTLDPESQQQISQLPVAQLENLAEALLDFSTVDDLRNWLSNH
jgi:hypothetical protein